MNTCPPAERSGSSKRKKTGFAAAALNALVLSICAQNASAADSDWPQWRHDECRTGTTTMSLPSTLYLQWRRDLPTCLPSLFFLPDDRKFSYYDGLEGLRPVQLGKVLFVNVPASDRVTAYDTDTGVEKWRYYTSGAVRRPPVAVALASGTNVVIFGSDDGYVYCLNANDGSERWKFRAAPNAKKVMGFNRLSSAWPIFASPVAYEGKVYLVAGYIPTWGLHGYCLDVDTGAVIWNNSGKIKGSSALGPISFSTDHTRLFGTTEGYDPAWVLSPTNGDHIGRAGPLPGKTDMARWYIDGSGIPKMTHTTVSDDTNKMFNTVKITVGGVIYDAAKAASLGVSGKVDCYAAGDGKLFVTTTDGKLYCFGPTAVTPTIYTYETAPLPPVADGWTTAVSAMLSNRDDLKQGLALVWGVGSGRLVEELAKQAPGLMVVAADPDAAKLRALRLKMDGAGWSGARVSTVLGNPMDCGFAPYQAALIASEDAEVAGFTNGQALVKMLYKCTRPFGGEIWLKTSNAQHASIEGWFNSAALPYSDLQQQTGFSGITNGFTQIRRLGLSDDRQMPKPPFELTAFGMSGADVWTQYTNVTDVTIDPWPPRIFKFTRLDGTKVEISKGSLPVKGTKNGRDIYSWLPITAAQPGYEPIPPTNNNTNHAGGSCSRANRYGDLVVNPGKLGWITHLTNAWNTCWFPEMMGCGGVAFAANGTLVMAPIEGCVCNRGMGWTQIGLMSLEEDANATNNAAFVSQSVPATMYADAAYTVSITMENTGARTWASGGSAPYKLGSQNPEDNATWGLTRVELPSSVVVPGGRAIFTFIVRAPSTPGTYNFQWRMAQDSAGSFGAATTNVAVTVTADPNRGTGTGLAATYYDEKDLTVPKLTRVDPTVDFNWGTAAPDASLATNTYSVRWCGYVQPKFDELYTFYVAAEDGVQLWVDGQPMFLYSWNNWGWAYTGPSSLSLGERWGMIRLSKGVKYDITLEYYFDKPKSQIPAWWPGRHSSAEVRLLWSSASQAKEIIPQCQLYPFTGTNNPPQIVTGAWADPNPVGNDAPATFSVVASDPDTNALSYTWNLGDGTVKYGKTISHRFVGYDRYYDSTVTVSDGRGGRASSTVTVYVGNVPQIGGVLNVNGILNSFFTYTIEAGNKPVSYDATGLPPGLTINTETGTISGTPTTGGLYTVTISATNPCGTATEELTINLLPRITSALAVNGKIGDVFHYTVTATNHPASFDAAGLPDGLSFNPSTGVISGTPAAAGTSLVTLIVSNEDGESSATLVLVVNSQNRQVWSWGENFSGLLGPFEEAGSSGGAMSRPYCVEHDWRSVSANEVATIAQRFDGSVVGSGYESDGYLGGSGAIRSYFATVPSMSDALTVAHSWNALAAVRPDGTLWTWGDAMFGQLGDGSTTNRSDPAQVPGLSNMVDVVGDYFGFLARNQAGQVWAWGYNGDSGVRFSIGDEVGEDGGISVPMQVPGLSNVTQIAMQYEFALFLKSDGTGWGYGCNVFGQLGDGTTTNRSSPVQVLCATNPATLLTGIRKVAAGRNHGLALDNTGQVWAWGNNAFSQLGDGSTTNRSFAQRVKDPSDPSGYLTGVTDIATLEFTSYAVKSDGTVVGWGHGTWGQFGSAAGTHTRLVPTPVEGLPAGIRAIWPGAYGVFAMTGGAEYSSYAAAHFTLAEIAAGLADPEADPDGDGQSNLLEWVLQTHPRQANAAPWEARREGNEFVFDVAYLRVGEGVTVAFQTSTDLKAWSAAAPASAEHTDAGDRRHTTLRFAIAPGQDRLFVRMKVSLIE